MKNYTKKEIINDNTYYYNDKGYHRTDGPAIEYKNGSKQWCINGKTHRLDGPAYITNNSQSWYVNGQCHRIKAPAIININNSMYYYKHNLCHRFNAPAWIDTFSNNKRWYNYGVMIKEISYYKTQ